MNRRSVPIVIVFLLILVAGCAGTDSGSATVQSTVTDGATTEGKTTRTDSPTTTDTTRTPSATEQLSDASYPPGMDESGYTNRSKFAEALTDAWASAPPMVRRTEHREAGSTYAVVIRSNPETDTVRQQFRLNGSQHLERYFTDGTMYANDTRYTETPRYEATEISYERALLYDGMHEMVFAVNLTAVDVKRTDGGTQIVYEVTGFRRPERAGNASGEVVVSSEGMFVRYHIEVEYPDRANATVTYTLTIDEDLTISRPKWVEEIKEESGS